MAACNFHANNSADDCQFLIFRKKFGVTIMDMKIKARLTEGRLYVEKKLGQTERGKYMAKYIYILLNLNSYL